MRLRPGTVALGHQKCKFFRDLRSDSMWTLCMCVHVSEPEVRTRIKLYRDLSGRVKQNLYFPLICPPIPILPDLFWWLSGKEFACMQKMWIWSPGWEDHLKKERQPIPVFLPGKSHGQRWAPVHGVTKELDMT